MYRTRGIPPGSVAVCRRCGVKLFHDQRGNLQGVLALNIGAMLFFALAHLMPFLTFSIEGRAQTSTFLSGPLMLVRDGYWPLGLVVFIVVSLFPAMRMVTMFWLLLPMMSAHRPPFAASAMRFSQFLRPWCMLEIFLLGVLVAYVKLSDIAAVELHEAVYAFLAAMLLATTADSILEERALWERLGRQARVDVTRPLPAALISCTECGQIDVLAEAALHPTCSRCGSPLHRRKPDSIARTWALVAAAGVLYIPANLLPVMTVVYFGSGAPNTIMSGVKELFAAGQVPIALLVFTASIVVPILKLVGMVWLLLSVQLGVRRGRRQRTMIFFFIRGVGRWSMVDIFMISILVSLVSLGAIATVVPGMGALSFAAVVLLTMLAAESFDPRLIWDLQGDRLERHIDGRI
ncbi:paraquat-inducible protein A [Arboricoccus pini]|uniref:paraquat-inducible protein A n=1 Tax=Arboricoccus pini TaxID=1963835 RepID=UPI0013FDC6B6|nr:paraquat-inducible protein A [Arboricoccus pini]